MDFPWELLGVNPGLVAVIITVVQSLKMSVLKNLPGWVYLGVTGVLSAALGVFSAPDGSGIDQLIREAAYWFAAAVATYAVVSQVPGLNRFFKSSKTVTK